MTNSDTQREGCSLLDAPVYVPEKGTIPLRNCMGPDLLAAADHVRRFGMSDEDRAEWDRLLPPRVHGGPK